MPNIPDNPLLLVVCFPGSVHSARWVSLLRDGPFRVVVFPSVIQDYCVEFRLRRTVRTRADAEALSAGEIGIYDHALIEPVSSCAEDHRYGYEPLKSSVSVPLTQSPSPASLVKAITALKPDLLHSLELQHASYLCLEARTRYGLQFPTWLVSSWGSDVYIYRKLPTHRDHLEKLARHIDGFHSDCLRDHRYIAEMGFSGLFFPHIPASGGVELADYPAPETLPPPSKRRSILVKGYQHWAGRALDILLAIHRVAPDLRPFEIRIALVFHPAVLEMAEILRKEDGLDVRVDPYFSEHHRAIKRMTSSRMVIGYGITDGISTTLLEAMAVGTFCIQADTACGREWGTPGRDFLEVPAHDNDKLSADILRAATDDDLVDAPVTRNRQTIEKHWSIPAVAPRTIEGYRELLGISRDRGNG